VYVPEPQTAEAAMVPGMRVFGIRSLGQVVGLLRGDDEIPEAPEVEPMSGSPLLTWRGEERLEDLDMADVIGIPDARYAVEVAAAGGHHLMLTGPKGSGKTTLAERIPGLLPDLSDDESLELTAVHSLSGALPLGAARLTRPPFRAPHHSASRTGILGGGSGRVRPGEVSKAHLGVLFLDEFPLFPSDVVEALREPLEAGEISISRGEEDATYPARTMFVFACNPCRCGAFHPYSRDSQCTCGEVKRREYRSKISGPIADRIDITRFVEPMTPDQQRANDLPFDRPEPSAAIRVRVAAARDRQRARYADLPWRLNVHVPGPMLRERWPLTDPAMVRLDAEVYSGRLTRRGAVRVHRVAWSVADLAGIDRPGVDELDVALRLRSATPLLMRSIPAPPDAGLREGA
jgi:magnesium chelatase family protein